MIRKEIFMNNYEIKNIVFDVGDVLVHFRYRDHMKDLGFSSEVVDFLSENMVLTDFWHELDLGIRTEQEAIDTFTTLYPQYDREIRIFWANTEPLVAEYPYAKPMIQSIREQGYGVYLLSNYPTDLSDRHWPKFTFLPETNGHIISAFEKMAKPDPRFYQLLTSRFGLNLNECIFIDDRPKNITPAAELGMKALPFTGYEKLKSDLQEFGIRIPSREA